MKDIFFYLFFLARIFPIFNHQMQTDKGGRDNLAVRQQVASINKKFQPSWDSLDSRALPKWYDEAKIGVFVHWGVFSVPGIFCEWFWYRWHQKWPEPTAFMKRNYPPGFQYADFGTQFKAELFNAKQWAELVARSGAKYFVFTSKHHEGFANWNTSYSWNWNSLSIGPHRDIVGELARAFRTDHRDITFGLYFSLYEWFNPLYLKDKANNFTTQEFIKTTVMPQLKELIERYKPEYLWSDGDWEAPEEYWDSKNFLAWLYNESPVSSSVVVNDRWGINCSCKHGDVHICKDRYNPGNDTWSEMGKHCHDSNKIYCYVSHIGELQQHKWENAMTLLNNSWGIRRDSTIEEYLTVHELLREIVTTVSCGGNILINISPASDGTIPVIFQERLHQMGDWLAINGEAIYGSKPWKAQNDTRNFNVWYTTNGGNVYATVLAWPASGALILDAPIPTQDTRVSMLGLKNKLFDWKYEPGKKEEGALNKTEEEVEFTQPTFFISIPPIPVSELPSLWAWVFKLTHVK